MTSSTVHGFIGAGNMAGAIVEGLAAAGRAQEVRVFSAHGSAAALAARTGAVLCASAEELVEASDVVVLAVKPRTVPVVLEALRDVLARRRPLVVSVAAGVTLASLEAALPPGTRVVRTMPNLAAGVRASMTAVAAGSCAREEDVEAVRGLMGAVGTTVVVPERDMPALVAMAGSSPAFVLALIEAMARGGVAAGLTKAAAVEAATQAVLGTALTVQAEARRRAAGEGGRTPADLVDAVCSPGGTTVAGLVAMERAGFSASVVAGVEAVVARDREIAGA